MLPRDVAAHADNGGESIVAGRAIDQHAKAGVGKACAGIFHHRMNHVAVAALDQHIGERSLSDVALGDGEQVLLAFRGRRAINVPSWRRSD